VSNCNRLRASFNLIVNKTESNVAYSPPNSCMPSRAKIRMKRKSRNKSDMMERMLLSSEMTRFRSDGQYLPSTTSTIINRLTTQENTDCTEFIIVSVEKCKTSQ